MAWTAALPCELEEIKQLRKEVNILRQEREILKRRQPSSPENNSKISFY